MLQSDVVGARIHIVREISGDPIALISSLLLIGFYLGQILLVRRIALPGGAPLHRQSVMRLVW